MKRNLSSSAISANPSSLANKYGIMMKQNNSLGSMGLNPNLNIEDEYIENLLKQIHFMNMEIKLIKEKQSQSDTNALWGIINRTNQPMVSNIVQSSQKCQQMKKQSDATLYKLQKDIARLDNDQGALQNQIMFLEKKKSEILAKQKNWQQECKHKHTILEQKIGNNLQKLKNILDQLQKQKKKNKELIEAQSSIVIQDESDKAKTEKQSLQIKNDEIIEQMIQKDLIGQISLVKLLTDNLVKIFEQNIEYIQSKQQNKQLRQKAAQVEKNIAGANFQLMQLNQSIKMAELEREKEIRERKKLTQDYEQKKTMLNQIIQMNAIRKQKQTMNRKKQSNQIYKAEQQTAKLQKNLQQLKKKLLKSEQSNATISNQVTNYERQIAKLQDTQRKLKQKINKLKSANDQSDRQLISINNELIITEDHYTKALTEQTNTNLDLFQLERQIQYLRGRRDLLTRSIQLKDAIDGLKIQDLQRVVQKNNDLNSTVATLMSKWDEIKSFSRI